MPIGRFPALAGIIPADAGSTRASRWAGCRPADHPRGCGEHEIGQETVEQFVGSSPRMRGALVWIVENKVHFGIIPANAGSTWTWHTCVNAGQDHPRGCGEHQRVVGLAQWANGSSPRMRGAHNVFYRGPCTVRIIPADAGSTVTGGESTA